MYSLKIWLIYPNSENLKNLLLRKCLPIRRLCLKCPTSRRSVGSSTSAVWRASILGYLAKFFKFLALSHIGKMEATVLRQFVASIDGTKTSIQRRRRTERVEKASRERTLVMAPDMEELLNSTCVQTCITKLSECTDTSTYSNVRGLIACMIRSYRQ